MAVNNPWTWGLGRRKSSIAAKNVNRAAFDDANNTGNKTADSLNVSSGLEVLNRLHLAVRRRTMAVFKRPTAEKKKSLVPRRATIFVEAEEGGDTDEDKVELSNFDVGDCP